LEWIGLQHDEQNPAFLEEDAEDEEDEEDEDDDAPRTKVKARGLIACDVFDVFATPQYGKALGRFQGMYMAEKIPPHGSRFLRLSGCAVVEQP
jgi:hypothetical protein